MRREVLVCLAVAAGLILGVSCSQLGEQAPPGPKPVVENLTQSDAIPMKWGKLVTVCSLAASPDWVLLCFQDDEGNIRFVSFNARGGFLSPKTALIRRN